MSNSRNFKRRVRAEMERTGESYCTVVNRFRDERRSLTDTAVGAMPIAAVARATRGEVAAERVTGVAADQILVPAAQQMAEQASAAIRQMAEQVNAAQAVATFQEIADRTATQAVATFQQMADRTAAQAAAIPQMAEQASAAIRQAAGQMDAKPAVDRILAQFKAKMEQMAAEPVVAFQQMADRSATQVVAAFQQMSDRTAAPAAAIPQMAKQASSATLPQMAERRPRSQSPTDQIRIQFQANMDRITAQLAATFRQIPRELMWCSKDLGDGVAAIAPSQQIQKAFLLLFAAAGHPIDMAVFSRYDLEKDVVTVYFSPGAIALAKMFGATPSEKPPNDEYLSLLVGDQRSRPLFFPSD